MKITIQEKKDRILGKIVFKIHSIGDADFHNEYELGTLMQDIVKDLEDGMAETKKLYKIKK